MATNFYNLFKPLTFLVSNAHFWLWHRCFLRVSPKPSSFGCIFPLWHRCFPLDFTGALFFVPSKDSAFSAILFELCYYLWPIACFCVFLMLNISFGCCRHSVSNTFVQLTEGRSARDQPKQPPAKKNLKFTLPAPAAEGATRRFSAKGERKARIRARTRVAKRKGKGKGKDQKG